MQGLLTINFLERHPLKGFVVLLWLTAACYMSVPVLYLYCRALISVLNGKVSCCFVFLHGLACGRSSWSSSWSPQCKGFLMMIPHPQLSRWCNAASSGLWMHTGMFPTLVVCQEWVWPFHQNLLKKTAMNVVVSSSGGLCDCPSILPANICKKLQASLQLVSVRIVKKQILKALLSRKSSWGPERNQDTHCENLSEELHVLSFSFVRNSNLCLPWFWKGSVCKSCMWTWVSAQWLLIGSQEYIISACFKIKDNTFKIFRVVFFRDTFVDNQSSQGCNILQIATLISGICTKHCMVQN